MTSASSAAPGFWRRLLAVDTPVAPLVLVAGALVTASAWLVISPPRILSRQMTWDMLFNLSGAWYLHNGMAPHVDFHDPLGSLSFWLTATGFHIAGPSVWACIAGEIIAAGALFVVAASVAARRLPLGPAIVFVVFICLLVLMPVNVGERVTDYSFAMDYNAIGWAALGVLSLLLFVPPRAGSTGWLDPLLAAGLLAALYALKITFFGVAYLELCCALAVSAHLRPRRLWIVLAAAVLLHVLAPYNWPYLSDVLAAVGSGAANSNPRGIAGKVLANAPELSLMIIGSIVAWSLWRAREVSLRLPVAAIVLTVAAVMVVSQNSQARGLPLAAVLAFVLYDHLRPTRPLWVLVALLVLPLAGIAGQAASLVSYHGHAVDGLALYAFDRAPLRGLALPLDQPGLLDAVGARRIDDALFSRIRIVETDGEEISQYEYAQTIEEAAALFDDPAREEGGIVVLDQVNPLPFLLGWKPPRGATLWLWPAFPWQSAEAMLGDAKYVLIPKFSTLRLATTMATGRYADYLAQHFPHRLVTRSWTLLSR